MNQSRPQQIAISFVAAMMFFVPSAASAAVGVDLNGSATIWWRVVDSSGMCMGSVDAGVGNPPFSQWNGVSRSARGSAVLGPFPNPGTYTFNCTGINEGNIGSDTITVCDAGTSWNGTSCVPIGVSGSISATNNPCSIASGANSCSPAPSISWSTSGATNPVVEVVGSISGSALFGSGASSPGQSASWITDYETFTFNLRNNGLSGPILASVTVDGQCTVGTAWTGGTTGSCQPPQVCPLDSSGCGTYGCVVAGPSCDCGAYLGWEVVGGVWQTCNMPPPNPFTLSGTTLINYGAAPQLSWSASPATSCSLYRNGVSEGIVPISATNYSARTITSDANFRVDCINMPSPITQSNTLTVLVRPAITVNGPTPAVVGQTVGPWASMDFSPTANATQCFWSRSGTGDPLGNWSDVPITGPQSWTNLGNGWNPGTYEYTFRCQSAGGAATEVTSGPHVLTVNPPAPAVGTNPSSGFIDIGNFLVGIPSTVPGAFTVVNIGEPSSSLTVNAITPSSGAEIVCTTCGPSGAIVAPGGSYPVDLAVNIPTPGIVNILFSINTSAGPGTMQVVANGQTPFNPLAIDFGRIPPEVSAQRLNGFSIWSI